MSTLLATATSAATAYGCPWTSLATLPAGTPIAFDLDNTLGDCTGAIAAALGRRFGVAVDPHAVTSSRIEESVPAVTGAMMTAVFVEERVFRLLAPLPGALDFAHAAASGGHPLHVITDRFWSEHDQADTAEWLAAVGFPAHTLHLCRAAEKAPLAADLGIALFCEDLPRNARWIAEVCPVVLVDQPHNRHETFDHRVTRIAGWVRATPAAPASTPPLVLHTARRVA